MKWAVKIIITWLIPELMKRISRIDLNVWVISNLTFTFLIQWYLWLPRFIPLSTPAESSSWANKLSGSRRWNSLNCVKWPLSCWLRWELTLCSLNGERREFRSFWTCHGPHRDSLTTSDYKQSHEHLKNITIIKLNLASIKYVLSSPTVFLRMTGVCCACGKIKLSFLFRWNLYI